MTTPLNDHIKTLLAWVDAQAAHRPAAEIPQYVLAAQKSLSKLVDFQPAQDTSARTPQKEVTQ